MRKIALISIIIVLFISMSFVSADDSLENVSLTTNQDEIVLSDDIGADDRLQLSNEISVDDSNYDKYFNDVTGKFNDDVDVSNINSLKIGNVSNKLFTIDRPLKIIPVSSDCQITNGVIHLVAGSDGSNVSNLIINNTKGEIYKDGLFICKLHGIWFSNSSYNYIYNNTIRIARAEGCYAMPMGYSSYNRILYNDLRTGFTCTMVMGLCHYNEISYNKMEIMSYQNMVTANCIYFNPFGHADYRGSGDCIGNNITNNYFKSNSNSDWSYVLALECQSNNTRVINNTVIGGMIGIKNEGYNFLIKENTIINSTYSIFSTSNQVAISDNKIIGSSKEIGIFLGDDSNRENMNITVSNNEINYDNLNVGIYVGANNAKIFNNKIVLSKYGTAITIDGNNTTISKNKIDVTVDDGIGIFGNNNLIINNVISTKNDGVYLTLGKRTAVEVSLPSFILELMTKRFSRNTCRQNLCIQVSSVSPNHR